MPDKAIYTITTLQGALTMLHRCVGYELTLEEAKDMVENNIMDISEEGYYHYCVIEKKLPGVYNFLNVDEWWYQWHGSGEYRKCEKPENFKRAVCFSMG